MNNITYAVSVDVNNPIIPYNVYVASVLDSNVRYLEITLYENGNVIALSNEATATASLVTDNVLVDDSVNCTISDNIITVPLEGLQRHGNLDVQVTVTEDTKVLAIPFPIQVRVTPNIAENAQIDENSSGSYAEVVHEIAEARGSYDKLKDRLDHTAAELALKANAADVYTKAETDGALSRKVDTSTFNHQLGNVIAALNTKADAEEVYKKSEVYSKSEVDEAVNNKTIDNTHIKNGAVTEDKLSADVRNKLNGITPGGDIDLSDYYTKDEVDSALLDKPDKSSVYTKAEIDNIIGSGSIVSTINSQPQTGDDVNYPSVNAVRNYSKSVIDDWGEAIENEIDAMLGNDCATPQMYGAKANGTANDTAAINAAIAAADTVWFPQGVYLIDGCPASATSTQSGIIVPSGKTLVFHKNAVLLKKPTLIKEDVLRLAPGAENVRIFGGVIRGDRSYKLKNLSAEQFHAYNGGSTGILMCGCKNVIVENTCVEDICGDGIALVYDEDGNCCEDITIRRCTVDRSWRNGICVGRALRVFIERCHITDSGCAEDENGLAIVRDELAYDANLISRSIITEGNGTLHGCLPRCGIDIESEARYSGEPLFSNEHVHISDSVFIGNNGDDIIMTNPCDHIYISGSRCEKRITSARNEPTDEIVISNSSLKDVNLHGERLVNCTVTGVVYAFKTGSRFENCGINSLQINASTDEEHTHYLSHCTIHSIESYGADKSTVLFQGCTFLFSADAHTAFGGKKMVLNNCDVIFDALYNPASTPLNLLRDFQAVNTTFKMLDSDNAHTLESFFKANSSGGSVTLEGCVLDLWPKVKNILNANIGVATVVNCAVINHNSVGALVGSGYIIHGNVYKNNPLVIPTKTSDLENDSGFLTSHQDISGKVDKVEGKGLSTNDYTTAEKNKLSGIETGATKTVIDSALSSTSTNPVQNKVIQKALNDLPAVPTKVSELTNDSGFLTSHQDISGKVDKTQKIAGVDLQDDITAAELKTALNVPTVPTNISAFTNDANYLTLATLPIYNGGVQ